MKSRWDESEAAHAGSDPLALRVYASQLLGAEPDLVLHGGGNTSVKMLETDDFGEEQTLLYVKGSGWDLASIEKEGFSPVRMSALLGMARLQNLSDTDMVRMLRSAMTNPYAPTPSVEAILHAIIPFRFVDHTHADAVVTVTNTVKGEARIREIYGNRVIVVPYVMPGFILAHKIYELTAQIDWQQYEGLILMHHGLFTFHEEARKSYENMITLVTQAEDYLQKHHAVFVPEERETWEDLRQLAGIRRRVSQLRGSAMMASINSEVTAQTFGNHPDVRAIATRGPLTPDHVIRTKRVPLIIGKNVDKDLDRFHEEYVHYFNRYGNEQQTCLDAAPRWAVWPSYGVMIFGRSVKEIEIVNDIAEHTMRAILCAEALGGWETLPEKDIFDVEYWELEQAKLAKQGRAAELQGKIALVTGAASGIGRACVEMLHSLGAAVAALDINPHIEDMYPVKGIVGIICDVTREDNIHHAIEATIRCFGGLDILISNAGIFPPGQHIVDMEQKIWEQSIAINCTSHQKLMKASIPYLSLGLDPSVVIIASKNVPAPGPGAAAYSVAKAGLTQLARVAALELAARGIRVNMLHPHAVFDTAIWTDDVLQSRAGQYGMTVEEYKKNNLLKVEITSGDVARLVCAMAGPAFAKTTGAQIPIDGGNDRVI